MIASYRDYGFRGGITEMRLLTRGSFLQDPAAHRLIEAGASRVWPCS